MVDRGREQPGAMPTSAPARLDEQRRDLRGVAHVGNAFLCGVDRRERREPDQPLLLLGDENVMLVGRRCFDRLRPGRLDGLG
jgi:hypothetical protein